MEYRTERDPLGELPVPADAYYGIQTARAVENFPISGLRAPAGLVDATILIKKAAAEANAALGRLDAAVAHAIVAAADEILAGGLRDQFVVDVYQAGAGTSHNMNANEVLANRAGELLGDPRGTYGRVHPNDHVNMSQSTNDVFPAATRLALLTGAGPLVGAAGDLADGLERRADAFAGVLKTGRTHLQDAVPITLGQEFSGYAACVRRGAEDVAAAAVQLQELNLGATAVGTGLNAGDDYRRLAVTLLARYTGLALQPAVNLFRVTQSMGDVLVYSGAMRRLAVELGKIAGDLRLLSMGPRAGIAEITLPAVQPGSSIMPGKVNPSVPEMVNQVCYQVMGCDLTISIACEAGQLELNVMMPVIAWNALLASTVLRQAMLVLRTRCVEGIVADELPAGTGVLRHMLSVLEDPAIRARVPALSVENYHRMFELGMIAPNIELIRGTLVKKMPKSPLHASIVEMLREHLVLVLPQGCFVRQEQPLTFTDSEPEPDIAVIRGVRRDFLTAHPETAELIIEVAVSSERIDRIKLGIYAEAGVRECWLVLAEERVIERHIDPQGAAYQRIERVTFPATLESTVCAGLTLPPTGLFPG